MPKETVTRAQHVQWCKARALEYVKMGEPRQAVTSMMSDLRKHPETADLVESLGPLAIFEAMSPTLLSATKFIEGFAE